MELEQVMGRANHGPFASNIVHPAEKELPEPSGLLDLAEYRLNGVFSQPVSARSPGAPDPVSH